MRTNISMMSAPILLSLNQRPIGESTGANPIEKNKHLDSPTIANKGSTKKRKKSKIKIESIARVARITVSPIVVPNKALRIRR